MTDQEAQLQERLSRARENNQLRWRIRAAMQDVEGAERADVTITRYAAGGYPAQITVSYVGSANPGDVFDALNNARLRAAGCDLMCVPRVML